MPLVNNQAVNNNEEYGITINQLLSLFIEPYFIERGRKFNKEEFRTALIETFGDGRKPKIRIGSDVPIVIEFKKRKVNANDIGKPTSIDLKDIKSISWHEDLLDKNSAKVLILRFNKDWWILNFDFRYNRGTVKQISERAEEFLSACIVILSAKDFHPHVLIYLIWSGAELVLDSKLALLAQKTGKTHEEKKKKLKNFINSNIFSPDFSALLFWLYKVRNGARYGNKNYAKKYNKELLKEKIKILEDEINSILV